MSVSNGSDIEGVEVKQEPIESDELKFDELSQRLEPEDPCFYFPNEPVAAQLQMVTSTQTGRLYMMACGI